MDCYREFISSTVSFTVAHTLVSSLTPELLSRFYNEADELSDPKYFSIFEEVCLSKLENVIRKRIVLLLAGDKDTFAKLHDKRIYDRLWSTDHPLQRRGEVLYFVLERVKRTWNLYELATEADKKTYVPILTELHFITPDTMHVARDGHCLLATLRKVLAAVAAAAAATGDVVEASVTHAVHGEHCYSLRELIFLDNVAKAAVCQVVGSDFILASHTRVSGRFATRREFKTPRNNMFGIHAIFLREPTDDGKVSNLDRLPIVCVTSDFRFYLLNEPYARSVRQVEQRLRHPKRQSFPGHAATTFDRLRDMTRARVQGRRRRRCQPRPRLRGRVGDPLTSGEENEEEQEEEEDGESYSIACPCDGCVYKSDFNDANMSFSGPQILYDQDLSCFDWMRLFGRFGKKCEQDLLHCCLLSAASYDLETMAVKVDDAAGNEDVNIPVSTLSGMRLPRQVQSHHEILRIGFQDQLRAERGDVPLILRYDEATKTDGLVDAFLETVFESRDAAVTVKLGILSEYFAYLDAYKRKHFDFWVSEKWLPADYCATRLPGFNDELTAAAVADVAAAAALDDDGDAVDDDAAAAAAEGDGLSDSDRDMIESLARRLTSPGNAAAADAAGDEDSCFSSCFASDLASAEDAAEDGEGVEVDDDDDDERPRGPAAVPGVVVDGSRHCRTRSSSSGSGSSTGTIGQQGETSDEEEEDGDDGQLHDEGGAAAAVTAAEKMRREREKRRIRDIEDAWKWSVWGLLERRLQYLAHAYHCYAFNR